MAKSTQSLLSGRPLGQHFGDYQFVEQTGSTNQDLLDHPMGDTPALPRLLWAGQQSAGRGRRGRSWRGQAGAALTFSIAIERQVRANQVIPAAMSLVVALVVADVVSRQLGLADQQVSLKWPNDVLYRHPRRAGELHKIAGILAESKREQGIERLVLGIGLNLRAPPLETAVDQKGQIAPLPAGGLIDADHDWTPSQSAELVSAIAVSLLEHYHQFIETGFAAFRERWCARDAFRDQQIVLSDGLNTIATGVSIGVAASGQILLENKSGVHSFAIGEVSARMTPNRSDN